MTELTAAIDAAAEAIARDRNPWAQSPDIIVDPDEYGICQAYAEIALTAAAELIVADTRGKVAEELKALPCCGPDDLQCCCCDELHRAITAIARGSGNGGTA